MRGSYCWTEKCVDTGFKEPAAVIDVAKGSHIGLQTNARIEPSSVTIPVYLIDGLETPDQIGELMQQEKDRYAINLQEGMYVLQVHANWEKLGDVVYSFKIRVN